MALEAEVRAKGANKLAGMQHELDQAQVRTHILHILAPPRPPVTGDIPT